MHTEIQLLYFLAKRMHLKISRLMLKADLDNVNLFKLEFIS